MKKLIFAVLVLVGSTWLPAQAARSLEVANIFKETAFRSTDSGSGYLQQAGSQKVGRELFVLSGMVVDSLSGETLPHASVQLAGTGMATQTNKQGFFSLQVPSGHYTLNITYVGFAGRTMRVRVQEDRQVIIALAPAGKALQEVGVSGFSPVQEVTAGRNTISIEQLKNIPALGGEPDVLKALQYLPGIKTAAEGTTNLAVRGGTYDQTLILLDGAPVYNPAHALSFFSIFHADAIKDVEIYKGLIPARYGSRLSSVVDIRMRDGNTRKFQARAGLGVISSHLTLEGPVKTNGSFIFSGRYGYPGATLNGTGYLLQQVAQVWGLRNFDSKNKISFYDVNARVNLGDQTGKNRFFLSAYQGHDVFNYYLINSNTVMEWGNSTVSGQWQRLFSPRFFGVTSATFSRYRYQYTLPSDRRSFDWSARQQEFNLKSEFDYRASPDHQLNFGAQLTRNVIEPGRLQPYDSLSVTRPFELDQKHSVVAALFAGDEWSPGPAWRLYGGWRQSWFAQLGPGPEYVFSPEGVLQDSLWHGPGKVVKAYGAWEPRLAATYLLEENRSAKAAFTRTVQFTHLLSNSAIGLPTDIWMPSGNTIRPQHAWQASLGYYHATHNNRYYFNLEGYYKRQYRVIDFVDNAVLFVNPTVENQVRAGMGEAYGAELLAEKKQGRLTGWFSYTWSKTSRTIPGINGGRAYPSRDDRRHSLSVVGHYEINKRLAFAANAVFNSGAPATVPVGTFIYQDAVFNYYDGRNSFRLPPYHRLDVSLTLQQRPKARWEGKWVFGVYNVYNRQNIFTASRQADDYVFISHLTTGHALFGVVPSVTYSLTFK